VSCASTSFGNGAVFGAPPVIAGGRFAYGVFCGWIENVVESNPMYCLALLKLGPGVPSRLRMPSDQRFQICWPFLGTKVPNR
jgi:hypothetical protein